MTERRLSAGPANSRFARMLLYLADGTMGGAVLYVGVSTVFFLFSGLEGWAIAIFLVFLGIGTIHAWAVASSARSQANRSETVQSQLSEEWKEVRRWTRVALVAVPVAAILVGTTVLRWGWGFGWFLPESNLLAGGTLGFGLGLRLLVRHLISSDRGSTFRPGTRRGLAGFLAFLLGLAAVLVWGDVPPYVLLLVAVGIGGYGVLYLLAAAGVD